MMVTTTVTTTPDTTSKSVRLRQLTSGPTTRYPVVGLTIPWKVYLASGLTIGQRVIVSGSADGRITITAEVERTENAERRQIVADDASRNVTVELPPEQWQTNIECLQNTAEDLESRSNSLRVNAEKGRLGSGSRSQANTLWDRADRLRKIIRVISNRMGNYKGKYQRRSK